MTILELLSRRKYDFRVSDGGGRWLCVKEEHGETLFIVRERKRYKRKTITVGTTTDEAEAVEMLIEGDLK